MPAQVQIVSLCITIIVALDAWILIAFLSSTVRKASPHTFSYVGEDYPTWYELDIGSVEMTFEETVHYPLHGPHADAEWDTLRRMDSHHGYIRLGPDKRVLAIAMFHELHCVNTLRKALVERSHQEASDHHVQHCLNYLRQFFLCAADSTLEPYDFMDRDFKIDTVGVTRQCRDWSVVYAETQRNYVEWQAWLKLNRSMAVHI